jgi:hypothetical protein
LIELDLSIHVPSYTEMSSRSRQSVFSSSLDLLSTGLQMNTNLTKITINCNTGKSYSLQLIVFQLDDSDVAQLCDGLRSNIGVKTLYLPGNNFSILIIRNPTHFSRSFPRVKPFGRKFNTYGVGYYRYYWTYLPYRLHD